MPTTCKVICESRELLFSQVVYHHFVPKSCEYYRQLYLEEAVLTLAIEEIIPELCTLSEVVISCHSSPLLKKKKKKDQCYRGVIYILYNALSLIVHVYEF